MLSDAQAVATLHLAELPPDADVVRDVLPRLIDRALILTEVERYAPPEPPVSTVDAQVARVRARFATPQAFADALTRVGFDARHLREHVRQDLRIEAYLSQRFVPRPPSEDDLARYYRDHLDQFQDGGRTLPLADAHRRVLDAATSDARQRLVDEWVAVLRRRTEIVDRSAVGR